MSQIHKPRKRFGQNFLHDYAVVENIVACVQPKPGDHIVEIGPGKGVLTEFLLRPDIQLDIIELDRDLVSLLEKKFSCQENLRVYSADALQFDFSELRKQNEKLRIVGNLPYNISTPLLFHLFENVECINDMYFMLQKQVVDRICALPGSKKYGRLSVMSQYYCSPEMLFEVAPDSFDPSPKVMSAVIRLEPHAEPKVDVSSFACLDRVVKQAFSQRRKTLRNSIGGLISEDVIKLLSIDSGLRAEALSLRDFSKLSNALYEIENG